MQTVPSLVGTGTAIAAAACGLVFGQSIDLNVQIDRDISPIAHPRARGHQRTTSIDRALPQYSQSPSGALTLPSRRPATSWTGFPSGGPELYAVDSSVHRTTRPPLSRRQRPQNFGQTSPSDASNRRQSMVEGQGNLTPGAPVVDVSRNSSSSSSSWLRRLSVRPLSQHDSPRSSILADSPSVTVSHGSGAPILSRSASLSRPLSPNKLVKRSAFGNHNVQDSSSQRKARGHLPSLRRPATSHQRSANLQQLRADIDVAGSNPHPKYSFDVPLHPEELLGASPIEEADRSSRTSRTIRSFTWVSFFHSETENPTAGSRSQHRFVGGGGGGGGGGVGGNGNGNGSGGGDAAPAFKGPNSKRIHLAKKLSPKTGAYLVKPRMVAQTTRPKHPATSSSAGEDGEADNVAQRDRDQVPSPSSSQVLASTRTGRSFSSTLSHTAQWASKTSGSLRRSKRGAKQGDRDDNKQRHVSAPVGSQPSLQLQVGNCADDYLTEPRIVLDRRWPPLGSAAISPRTTSKRNASSPLPRHSRPSGINVDSWQRTPVGAPTRPNQPSGSSTSSASAAMSQRRAFRHGSFSALDSSDGDARDLMLGDEDDTDFKSDTLFDSVRTVDSSRIRAVDTPLESVCDESPPSTGGYNKRSKRRSLQEILDRYPDQETSITEEEEAFAIPGRVAGRPFIIHVERAAREDARSGLEPPSTPRHVGSTARKGSDGSPDDDFDEDWTRDEEDTPFNALSPSSKGNASSLVVNESNVRLALASLEGKSVKPSNPTPSRSENSLGNLFSWSEAPALDQKQSNGGSLRPKTAYGKQQQLDSRGGRSVMRKGPTPTHVRSQSVPVVHEGAEDSKPIGAKYGTWGLGTKTVSEDWDEDFEFGGSNDGHGGSNSRGLFAVPESIRLSQPSVKAHSGQIRELSLLVNDLKRLCRHGRELDMLGGDEKPFWKEAEGIIALASPDEEHLLDDDDESGSSVYLDAFSSAGPDAAMMERDETGTPKTAVVGPSRRRSVLSSDDDIFGAKRPLSDDSAEPCHPSPPRTPETPVGTCPDVNIVVRSVVETMQHRLTVNESRGQDSRKCYTGANRMHFDTSNLRALVKRAGELRDMLSDIIRRADQLTQSPMRTPRQERRIDSSPAFTRVFDDPGTSPPCRLTKHRDDGTTGLVEKASPEPSSPQSNRSPRVPLMTMT